MLDGPAAAQSPMRDGYHRHLPSMPRLIAQTAASTRLHLYWVAGAAGYRDEVPADDVDNDRARTLHGIATRFAPILRRNNFSRSLGGVTRREFALGLVVSW